MFLYIIPHLQVQQYMFQRTQSDIKTCIENKKNPLKMLNFFK